ncbi:MAG: hypothetical protein P0S95_04605 [Rhabdochlamydiaceae bacterium]|nr:hypothetical protein [Candidatus Amphrikana amoebophyrae]
MAVHLDRPLAANNNVENQHEHRDGYGRIMEIVRENLTLEMGAYITGQALILMGSQVKLYSTPVAVAMVGLVHTPILINYFDPEFFNNLGLFGAALALGS